MRKECISLELTTADLIHTEAKELGLRHLVEDSDWQTLPTILGASTMTLSMIWIQLLRLEEGPQEISAVAFKIRVSMEFLAWEFKIRILLEAVRMSVE